jgi:hypothetical protein
VYESEWPPCFTEESDADDEFQTQAALDREVYYQMGLATLQQSIFLMLVDDLVGKPEGFSKVGVTN